MSESVRRSRAEKVAFARFIGGLLAPIAGIEDEILGRMLGQYAEEVLQFNYNSKYETVLEKHVRTRIEERSEDQRLLRKVADMTVTDEDMKK